jgi:glycosyltransferase involved in cell wall biosynthesis
MAEVSVIIPTYNRSDKLDRAIQSVRNQTFEDWELIVVDDGSTDNTETVVNNIPDKRIIYEKHEVNKGGSAARNTGVRLSKGRYILMLDDDDLIKRNHIEVLSSKIKKLDKTWGIVYTGMEVKRGGRRKKIYRLRKGDITKELIVKGSIGTPAVSLVRKRVAYEAGLFDERLPRHQDWDFYLRLSEITKFYPIKKATVVKNFTGKPTLKETKKAKTLIEKKHSSKIDQLSTMQKKKYTSNKVVSISKIKLNEGNYVDGLVGLARASIMYPKNFKKLIGVLYEFTREF